MAFLLRFDDLMVHSELQDTVTTSQRAESIMIAALRNHIRSVVRGFSSSMRGFLSSVVSGDNYQRPCPAKYSEVTNKSNSTVQSIEEFREMVGWYCADGGNSSQCIG